MAEENSSSLAWGCSPTGHNCSVITEPGSNATDQGPPGLLDTASVVVAASSLALIMVLSALGNIMVLYVIFKHLRFKTVTNTFITTLSVSDLLSTFGCMPLSLVTVARQEWLFQTGGCVASALMINTFSLISTLMLMFITIDRFFVVVRLPRKPLAMTSALVAIAAACCLSLVVCAPWYLLVPRNASEEWVPYKAGYQHCMYTFHLLSSHYQGAAYSAIYIIVCYAVPVSCMVYCAACLWRIIHHNDSRVRPSSTPASQIRFNGEMRTAKTVVVMVIMFIVTRIPYILVGVVCAMIGRDVPVALDTAALWLFWSNCAVNPVIYAFRNPTVAQMLSLGRRSGYQADNPACTDYPAPSTVSPRDIAGEFLTPRQCKYLPSTSGVQPSEPQGSNAAGKDQRSDSIPSVLLFRTSDSPRKGSGFSTITTSTNTTMM